MWIEQHVESHKKLEDDYLIVKYSRVKFSRTLANREYRENYPPAKNTCYIMVIVWSGISRCVSILKF